MQDPGLDQRLGALMQRFQAGDEAAFGELYGLCAGPLTSYLQRWVRGDRPDDLVQETFLRVIRARQTYQRGAPFRPWLFAIARHVALDMSRKRTRRGRREVAVDVLPERGVAPQAEAHVDAQRVAELLELLPENQREVVWLARVEGLTSVEIARVVGASPGAVKVRLHRATMRLRELLGPRHGPALEETP
ncbi:MAG: RNA polymerase sigma factor [Acidobacteria bacterium]|nr:RNA polymerase sigma factor [Acidobacteriota bacterium]